MCEFSSWFISLEKNGCICLHLTADANDEVLKKIREKDMSVVNRQSINGATLNMPSAKARILPWKK